MIDPGYSPFFDWNPKDPISADSLAKPFIALVSMVRDDYHFDEMIEQKAFTLLSFINRNDRRRVNVEELLKSVGWSDFERLPEFVDSTIVLLSSPSPIIMKEALTVFQRWFTSLTTIDQLMLVSSNLFPNILSTLHLLNLSAVEDKRILTDIVRFSQPGVWLSSIFTMTSLPSIAAISAQSIQDVVLHKCLIPMGPSLVQIPRNPHILSWINEYKEIVQVFYFSLRCECVPPTDAGFSGGIVMELNLWAERRFCFRHWNRKDFTTDSSKRCSMTLLKVKERT
ncbi:hypothetical protein BLNAU_16769 [Blattamonas nauphoetae]|uniref:Uncharacterized protein n=1 Tax=Blattamonas nauphoetae TaxID=2049346 RepID=A0ABQ9XAG3_9EUKA|nr:hypothetical protein BLNAU_16769 [Blattamonas nauphoetae]